MYARSRTFSGTNSSTTTQIYTHVSDQKLKDAMEANPPAKRKSKKDKTMLEQTIKMQKLRCTSEWCG